MKDPEKLIICFKSLPVIFSETDDMITGAEDPLDATNCHTVVDQ